MQSLKGKFIRGRKVLAKNNGIGTIKNSSPTHVDVVFPFSDRVIEFKKEDLRLFELKLEPNPNDHTGNLF